MSDARRLHAPATHRNRDPILSVLRRVLPAWGTVLEVAAGTGEHAVYFAGAFPGLQWQPSDLDAQALESIASWRKGADCDNLLPPVRLDVTREDWQVGVVDAVFCANMVHIAPWQACLGLLEGCGRNLRAGGVLVLYGPYRLQGSHTAPSNESFDRDLRSRNPSWGIRDLEEVAGEAALRGLVLEETVAMPANNFTLVFRRN